MSLLRPGSLFASRFEIDRVAGAGGMGTVYRARDRLSGDFVALKLLNMQGTSAPDVDRFLREADILANLRHPGIVAHIAHGRTSDGECFLAMEWLDGEDLAHRLMRGPLSVADAVLLLRSVAQTMSMVHEQGIVHRDLKPRNLFLPNGDLSRVKVLDFGIARRTVTVHSMTGTGRLIGTPAYMAPEQVAGKKVITAAADIFSLGCILHECLAGEPPFDGEQIYALLVCILFEEPRPITAKRPDVPAAVSELIQHMLVKEPTRRVPNAHVLLTELSKLRLSAVEPIPDLADLRRKSPGFGEKEQALISLVIATPHDPPSMSQSQASDSSTSERHQGLLNMLASLDVHAEVLMNGSLVASIPHAASANDQAARAARVALLIKEAWPNAEVVVATGRGTAHGTTTLGEVAERAARLLRRRADPGRPLSTKVASGVWVDELSARLLGDRFVMEFGHQDVLLLGQAREEDTGRPLLGKPTSCVGRDAELTMLETQLTTCIDESEPLGVVMTAPPGVGKSRLRHEFLRRIEKQKRAITILKGRGDMMSAGAPFGVLSNALRQLCQINGSETLAEQHRLLRQRVLQYVPEAAAAHQRMLLFLGELCSIPFDDSDIGELQAARQDPKIMRESIHRAFLDWLAIECRHAPVLFVFDDLQWGDALSVSLIHEALLANRGSSLFVLALARPEIHETFPNLWEGQNVQRVSLKGLGRKPSERLIYQVLGTGVAPDVVARIIEQSSGNALYLEELIRAAAEGKLEEQPETVVAMLQARVGQFEAGPRHTLLAASVFGESFWRGGVAAVLGKTLPSTELDAWLTALVRLETIEPTSASRLANEKEYRFRHALLRDAAYSLLAERDRAFGHRIASQYLEQQGETDAMLLAEHAQRGEDVERAATLFARAAEQSFERQDLHGVLKRSERGLSCGARLGTLGQLRALQSAAYMWGEDWSRAYEVGMESLTHLEHGSPRWLRTLSYLFVIAGNLVDGEPLQKLFGLFATVEPSQSDAAAYIQAAGFVTVIFSYVGMRLMAEPLLRTIQRLAQSVPATDILSRSNVLWAESSFHYYLEPTGYRALTAAQEATQILRNTEALRQLCTTQVALGLAQARMGDLPASVQTLRDNLLLAQRLREPFNISMTELYLAECLAQSSDRVAEADAIATRTLCQDPNARPAVLGAGNWIHALFLASQQRFQEAEAKARAAALAMGPLPIHRTQVLTTLAQILLQQGRHADARTVGDDALQVLDACGGLGVGDIAARVVAADAHWADGDEEGARIILHEALQRLRHGIAEIPDPALQARFLSAVPEHVRANELALRLHLEPVTA